MPPCPPSLGLGLGLPFVRGGGARLDPDAAAYIALITAAGADLGLLNEEAITKKAISDSIIERKDLHIWELERRTYMPIWGIAAANAICMRSLTSGTFVGGVTHGAGFVQGNGTTGYLKCGVVANSLTATDFGAFFVTLQGGSSVKPFMGASQSDPPSTRLQVSNWDVILGHLFDVTNVSGGRLTSPPLFGTTGIHSYGMSATTQRARRRNQAGIDYTNTRTPGSLGILPAHELFFMANNLEGVPSSFGDARLGSFGITRYLTSAQDEAFTGNLKILFETCTGLSLPA
jgi:hypothetical protein